MRYDGTPLAPLRPSSTLGAENRQVYGDWLGVPPEEMDRLVREGVI